jgi:hypothetical protein
MPTVEQVTACLDDYIQWVKEGDNYASPEAKANAQAFYDAVNQHFGIKSAILLMGLQPKAQSNPYAAHITMLEVGFVLGQRFAAQQREVSQLEELVVMEERTFPLPTTPLGGGYDVLRKTS